MSNKPLVSVIIPFLNAEQFIQEAIDSVFAQGYDDWELLLVDDGSTDRSTEIARSYAGQNPRRLRYLEHPAHQNRGISASRNLGLRMANGEYIAFLDADDVWFPYKLEQQIATMRSQPRAGMIYGTTQYWYSWTGHPEDQGRDYLQRPGLGPNTLIEPPMLLSYFLQGKAAVPTPCNILVRREVFQFVGSFEEQFRGMYEDQAFYAKVCLRVPVLVSHDLWDRYRQHGNSVCSVAAHTGGTHGAHLLYLRWLESYLVAQGFEGTELWRVLRNELNHYEHPNALSARNVTRYLRRRGRKLWLRIGGRVFGTEPVR